MFYIEYEVLYVLVQVWEVFDVLGVGDIVIVMLVVLLGVGVNIKEVVQYVNCVGGIVVGKLGIVVVMYVEFFN